MGEFMETKLYVLKNDNWRLQETFTGGPGGREFAIERAAIWRAHGHTVKLSPDTEGERTCVNE